MDDSSVDVGHLLLGLVVGVIGVFLLADVSGRVARSLDPARQQKLAESAGGLMAWNSRGTRVVSGIVCLLAALILIVSSL
jgi:hypothetical protein